LAGKKILVTGASSGIGAATAELLAAEGASVVVHYGQRKDGADDVASRIRAAGGTAHVVQADLLDESTWTTLVPKSIDLLGGLDALVNNAGRIVAPTPVLDLTPKVWRDVFTLNVEAPFFLAQAAFAHMQQAGAGGRIVNISSIGVKFGGSPTSLHYSASKQALEGATFGLAKAGAPLNILVNAIRPGVIDTPIHSHQTAEAMQRRVQMIPLKRFGTALEIARMISFLVGPGGDFITGQVFAVSGGE
jgi:3-oxoacyl-[acyl-carrier protein] reductase